MDRRLHFDKTYFHVIVLILVDFKSEAPANKAGLPEHAVASRGEQRKFHSYCAP
jgi:hypothetical protein